MEHQYHRWAITLALVLSVGWVVAMIVEVTVDNVFTTGASLLLFARVPYFPLQNEVIPIWIRATTLCERYDLVGTYDGPKDTMFVVYQSTSGSYVISFRGTSIKSRPNIFTDLDAWPVECTLGNGGCGMVHKGFQEAYLGVAEQVVNSLKGAQRIAVTGHSLGGALALMAGVDLAIKVTRYLGNVFLICIGPSRGRCICLR